MNKRNLTSFIFSFVFLLVAFGAYSFEYSLVQTKSAEAASIANQISVKSQTTSRLAAAKTELASLSSEEQSINQYFVSTNDIVPFLEQLTATGKYLGSNVNVVSVSASPSGAYEKLNLAVTITGSFNSVLRTIGAIEYGPYDTSISSLSFDAPVTGSVGSSSPQWTATALFMIGAQNSASSSSN